LKDRIIDRIDVLTPFEVEFARTSRERGGSPTLVPVTSGGAQVRASILLVDDRLSLDEATDMLYRRERHLRDRKTKYVPTRKPGPNTVVIDHLDNFCSVPVVLYTRIATNIQELTGSTLAGLAIDSINNADQGKDGISYLLAAKRNGIVTPLTPEYEHEILRVSGAADLETALRKLRKPQQESAKRNSIPGKAPDRLTGERLPKTKKRVL
jgi:hypothetical protein